MTNNTIYESGEEKWRHPLVSENVKYIVSRIIGTEISVAK